eukprot:CAMPEP_0177772838 /NCGR_PEP_ID=MMETSP0491_2-20121128/12499_1 /TAXON_ID=63592 /ORGANISM="Tetraselmis chuii, Strain PLY429" /LENGTH=578 /DNA_ID=CAMNT_0019290801 /DNA_START=66 /DNA_END=1802 /DNA_ORIENTATION=+
MSSIAAARTGPLLFRRAASASLRHASFASPVVLRPTGPRTTASAPRRPTRASPFNRQPRYVVVSAQAAAVDSPASSTAGKSGSEVRVRFAPSPTGNLHVGGARTALFNWLYARRTGGKFVLRVEDTDTARSTRESEEAMIRDLKWLGLDWDEGPDCPGECGPYRQSERTQLYKDLATQLVEKGLVYPCFCTDEELEAMKVEAEAQKLPPIYRGKWASASAEEVEEMKQSGAPFCYRFRVPKNKVITIQDTIRGEVSWNTDTLGDFVVLRSNGMPVYNFCVAIDDALMGITHVIRAEEHLPNTLRQMLIYEALGFTQPTFAHCSLILAPDRSKLSKRHGATSVGDFRTEGYLSEALVNYLSLLGWNDGTEQEIYTVEELCETFSIDRITKSAAVFDKVKLSWMNGQHLRAYGEEELVSMVGGMLQEKGLLKDGASPFARAFIAMVSNMLELVTDAEPELTSVLSYPLEETVASEGCKSIVEDNLKELAEVVLAKYDSGELVTTIEEGGMKKWIKALGKEMGIKGKRLFMPLRVALTGKMAGPDIGEQLSVLALEDGDVNQDVVRLPERMEKLRLWVGSQ